jgi:hypothetical protein
MFDLNLTFQYYIDKNEDPASDYFYTVLSLSNGSDSWRMYYYLNGTTSSTNDTSTAYFLLNEPVLQWNRFYRNVTDDFVSVPEFTGTIDANLLVEEIEFYGYASGDSTDHLRGFVDDVNVVNATNGYVWIGGATGDGNFESGTAIPWVRSVFNLDAASFYQSPDAHSGSWSLNTTASSFGNMSAAYAYTDPRARLTSQNHGILKFWWNLSHYNADPDSRSFIFLNCTTDFGSRDIYYFLGYGGSGYPFGNDSFETLVYLADSFNETAGWNQFQRNIWTDAAFFFSVNEIIVERISFWSLSVQSESAITTLFDDISFVSRTINDADYEDQQTTGTSIRGWETENPAFTVTDVYSVSGSKAANLTVLAGNSWTLEQPLHGRPLNGTRETYLDVSWWFEDYIPPDQVCLEVVLRDGKIMRYYMAATTLPANGTTAHFNVTGVGTTDTWMTMHRDLNHDYEAVFGGLPNTMVESIVLNATTSGGKLQLILDDLYLYDDNAPYITNVGTTLTTHDQQVNVTAEIFEQDLDTALFHYRVNSGDWQNSSMLLQTGDTYNATIPSQVNGTFVEYFITANDTWSMETIALNDGAYWNYTVTDLTPPSISAVGHTPTPVMYTDIVEVSADADDTVAGIKTVSLYYRVDGGAWDETSMSLASGTTYEEQIPAQAWSALVEYYINATDNKNNSRIDNNGGSYYSYTVGDNVNPVLSITIPTTGATISGSVDVTASAIDPGSGIQRVEFRVNGDLVLNDTTFPYVYYWNTPDSPNGSYIINVTAFDVVGLTATQTITVTVNNAATTTPPGGIPPLLLVTILAIGVIVLFAVIVTFYVFIRQR